MQYFKIASGKFRSSKIRLPLLSKLPCRHRLPRTPKPAHSAIALGSVDVLGTFGDHGVSMRSISAVGSLGGQVQFFQLGQGIQAADENTIFTDFEL